MAQKNQNKRADLNVLEARRTVVRTFTAQPMEEQIRTYNSVLASYGRGAGITFFDQVVVPFAEHLWQLQQPGEAEKAVAMARQTLKVDGGSQLARDFDALAQRLKVAP